MRPVRERRWLRLPVCVMSASIALLCLAWETRPSSGEEETCLHKLDQGFSRAALRTLRYGEAGADVTVNEDLWQIMTGDRKQEIVSLVFCALREDGRAAGTLVFRASRSARVLDQAHDGQLVAR